MRSFLGGTLHECAVKKVLVHLKNPLEQKKKMNQAAQHHPAMRTKGGRTQPPWGGRPLMPRLAVDPKPSLSTWWVTGFEWDEEWDLHEQVASH